MLCYFSQIDLQLTMLRKAVHQNQLEANMRSANDGSV